MRILYHHRTQAEDGQAVHIRALIGAFRALGHEVREVSLVPRTTATVGAGAPARQRSGLGWVTRAPRFARELAEYGYGQVARGRILRAAHAFEPHFLYERYAFGNTGGVRAARVLGLPIVLEVNSPMVLELGRTRGLSFPRLAQRVEQQVFTSATLVCAVTRVLGDMLVELGVSPERVLVTPNGVDLERYQYGPDARTRARTELGLPATGLVLGFVGFYRDWHRLDLVLDAMRAPELGAARLVLVGEGPARAELEARAAAHGLTARVHFAGPRPHGEVPALLPAIDVALVPAINPYASPLKLFEYMAAGLAVLAPDQPNLREVLVDGADALLVRSGEPAPLAQALVRLAGDAELRTRLGAAARAKVAALDLTWAGNARRVVAAVEALGR